ncbi:MAG: hypothetical protein ACRDLB_10085, partial [Actinomycetota bacterium]
MLQYIIRRLLWAVVMIVLVVAVVFCIFFVLPGGTGRARTSGECSSPVAVQMAGRNPRPKLVCSITKRLGLDQPVYVQFWRYIKNAATGDFGYSYH